MNQMPPKWASNAVPTVRGWAHPETGEILIARKGLILESKSAVIETKPTVTELEPEIVKSESEVSEAEPEVIKSKTRNKKKIEP